MIAVEQSVNATRSSSRTLRVRHLARDAAAGEGVLRRLFNVMEALLGQGDIHHVASDLPFATYLLPRRRTVLSIDDCAALAGPEGLRKRISKLLRFTLPVQHCAAITVPAETSKQELLRHVPTDPEKIHVIPVSVPALFRRIDKPFDAARPRILQIGSGRSKNRERLFDALQGIPCTLAVIGPLSAAEVALLDRYGISYTSYPDCTGEALLERYRESDIVAYPSTYEGIGLPIIEAQRVGRPVLAGNTSAMPEVAGGAAELVNPFDVSDIRAGLRRIIEDAEHRAALIERGFENAKRSDPARVTRLHEALYQRLWSAAVSGS